MFMVVLPAVAAGLQCQCLVFRSSARTVRICSKSAPSPWLWIARFMLLAYLGGLAGADDTNMVFCNMTNSISSKFLFPSCTSFLLKSKELEALGAPTFPGGSPVDAFIRSRGSPLGQFGSDNSNGAKSEDTDKRAPGMRQDNHMERTVRNNYFLTAKTIKAEAWIDHFLCMDSSCTRMLDLYWGAETSLRCRFSVLLGTDQFLSTWAFGSDETPRENCSALATPVTTMAGPLIQMQQCIQEYKPDSFSEYGVSRLSTIFSSSALVDDFNGKVELVYGNFKDGNTCYTMIVPRLIVPRLNVTLKYPLDWSKDDGCSNPVGTFLFLAFVPYAYVPRIVTGVGLAADNATRDPKVMRKNFRERDGTPFDDGISTPDDIFLIRNGYPTNWTDKIPNEEYLLLVAGGLPVWVRNLTAKLESQSYPYVKEVFDKEIEPYANYDLEVGKIELDRKEEYQSLAEDIYHSVLASALETWCDVNLNAQKMGLIKDGDGEFNTSDCPNLKRMGLLQRRPSPEGKPLKNVRQLVNSSFATGLFDFLSLPIDSILLTAAHDFEVSAFQALVATDVTATKWGVAVNFIVVALSSFAAYLGVNDVYNSCAEWAERHRVWKVFAAILVTLVMAGALGTTPLTFLLQESMAHGNNPEGDELSVTWYSSPPLNFWMDEENSLTDAAQVVSAVTVTYTPIYASYVQIWGWAAAVLAALAFIFSLKKIWQGFVLEGLEAVQGWQRGGGGQWVCRLVQSVVATAAFPFKRLRPEAVSNDKSESIESPREKVDL